MCFALNRTKVYSLLGQYFRAMLDGTKSLHRWMHGTVELAPPMRVNEDDDEPVVFSFYDDIAQDSEVQALLADVDLAVVTMFKSINEYLIRRWFK